MRIWELGIRNWELRIGNRELGIENRELGVGKGSVHYIGGNFVLGGTALECYASEATALSRTVSSRVVFFGQESGTGMAMSSSYGISWSSNAAGSGDCFTNRDLFLLRDGAGILGDYRDWETQPTPKPSASIIHLPAQPTLNG